MCHGTFYFAGDGLPAEIIAMGQGAPYDRAVRVASRVRAAPLLLALAALLLFAGALAAQGLGQSAFRAVGIQDAKDPSIRGAGVAITHGVFAKGNWFGTIAVGAVKTNLWSQAVGLDVGYAWTANPGITPYVAGEWNQTRVSGSWTPGYVVFAGVTINRQKARKSYRDAEVVSHLILEPRLGRLLGANYWEFDLGVAP